MKETGKKKELLGTHWKKGHAWRPASRGQKKKREILGTLKKRQSQNIQEIPIETLERKEKFFEL